MNPEPKKDLASLACMGGPVAFAEPVHVGQLNLPPWEEFEKSFRDIFARRYFTNHGPLVRELDRRLAEYLGVRHVICVTNATVALMVACKALELRGEVIVPAFTFPASVQALTWAGLTPVFCDVDPLTHNITADLAAPLIGSRTSAILGVHAWGRACDPDGLATLCAHRGVQLFYDAAHGIGCTYRAMPLAALGAVAIFSFHATKVFSSAEGGCLATNDDRLAGRIRTVRNFHVSETYEPVPLRINGKMTEAQAAMGLLSLDHLAEWVERNERLYVAYQDWDRERGAGLFVNHAAGERSNYQYCIMEIRQERIGFTRDQLLAVLRAENVLARRYFYPGVHRLRPYCEQFPDAGALLPNTERLNGSLLQLPIGFGMTEAMVARITSILDVCLDNPAEIAARVPA